MRRMIAAVLTATVMSIGGIALAPAATAAGCTYSNLTSIRVFNKTCRAGAYAYRSGNLWYRNGDWVATGTYSYNWSKLCFANPGMLGLV